MSANQLLDQSDYQRLAEFRYHLRGFLRFSERAASEMGLRPQQHQALLAIKGTPEGQVTIGILAELSLAHRNEIRKLAPLLIGLLARFDSPKKQARKP